MAGRGHIRVNRLSPHAPILCNTEHAVCRVGGVKIFMRDEGCGSVGFSQHKSAKIRDSVVGKVILGGGMQKICLLTRFNLSLFLRVLFRIFVSPRLSADSCCDSDL